MLCLPVSSDSDGIDNWDILLSLSLELIEEVLRGLDWKRETFAR